MAVARECAVLVVEDHLDTADMIKRVLARHGVTVEVARSGREALELIDRVTLRCLVLDEAMPDMTGLALYRQLLSRPGFAKTPVFFYTASYEWRKQMEAEQLGARGWFVKGISRLSDLIHPVLDACR
jgi:CheY-like chemotaxis protein